MGPTYALSLSHHTTMTLVCASTMHCISASEPLLIKRLITFPSISFSSTSPSYPSFPLFSIPPYLAVRQLHSLGPEPPAAGSPPRRGSYPEGRPALWSFAGGCAVTPSAGQTGPLGFCLPAGTREEVQPFWVHSTHVQNWFSTELRSYISNIHIKYKITNTGIHSNNKHIENRIDGNIFKHFILFFQ